MSIHEYRHFDLNLSSPPDADISGQGSEPNMVSDVLVANVQALSHLVYKLLLFLWVSDPHNRDGGYCQRYPGLGMQNSIFMSNRIDYFSKITFCGVRLRRRHFEHPAAILQHQRESNIFVLG